MEWRTTWLGIANNALSRINKQILQTMDDSSKSALLCNQLIPSVTKNILNRYDWHSARKRMLLAPMLEEPVSGYLHQFELPVDFVRLMKVIEPCTWTREGGRILANRDTVSIIYIAYPQIPDSLDPLIIDAITSMLAAELSVSLTSDTTLTNLLMQETESKITAAMQQEQAAERDITVPMNDIAAAYRRESVTGMDDGRYTMLAAGMYRQMLGERD